MMDSEKTNRDLGYDSNSEEESPKDQNQTKSLGTLTPDELTGQGILFFVAGYDTTSAALSHLVYYLAQNKDCQQRLYEELKDINEFTYDKLGHLKYLNAVIDETLRLAPSLVRIQRQCEKELTLNGRSFKYLLIQLDQIDVYIAFFRHKNSKGMFNRGIALYYSQRP